MRSIGVVVRPGVRAIALAQELLRWASDEGHAVVCDRETSEVLGQKQKSVAREALAEIADPIVTLGGDGTLIGVARHIRTASPVFVGVNFGNLGFLTEITPGELFATLEALFQGKAAFRERSLLQVEVHRDGGSVFRSQAVNDVVIQKGATDRLVELDLAVNLEPVMRLRADGLIIATPTGSTAYSLAAGGSIVDPQLAAVLVTPLCAHALTARPLILQQEAELTITLPPYDGKVHVSVDGQVSTTLEVADVVRVTKAPQAVKFVRSLSRSYFDILRTKLNWGLGNSAG